MNAVSSDIENVQPAGNAAMFRRLAVVPLLAAAIVFLTSAMVSVGWAFEIDTLRRVAPGYVVMNPVTAALFVLSSAALFLVQTADARRIRLAYACAVFVALVGLLQLCALVGIFDVGIDQIFYKKPFIDVASGVPNRMAPNTALNFLLFGASILLSGVRTKRRDFFPAQYPLVVVLLTAFLATVGYIYGAKSFYVVVSFNPMAIHTATSFLLLSVGLLLSKPRRGWIKEIFSPLIGGQQARRLFPLVIIIPLVLGWVQLKGEQSGFYATEIGFAMLIVAISIILGFVVIYSARLTNRTAGRLVQTEDALDSNGKLLNLLGESETRYRRLADAMPQIVWTARADGFLDYYNQRWFDYTGLTLDETVGWGWAPVLHPDDLQNCIDVWSNAVETGEKYTVEYRFKRGSDGAYRWHLGRALPARDRENRVVKWFGTCTDIHDQKLIEEELRLIQEQLEGRVTARTAELERANLDLTEEIAERRRAEEELKDFAARLERSNNELQDFAAVASHDLQEPLRKVQAFGDRLKAKSGDALSADGRDYLERMLNAAGRMQTLINDLLSFSRVATKAQPFVPVNLRDVTDDVLSDLETSISETNARVEIGDLGVIDADPTQMRQLMQNLIGNALKFNRPGVAPVVKISGGFRENSAAEADGAGVKYCLTVEDNGIGFDNKYVDRIFKIFQRLHSRSEYEGTGIGLAVCRRIAERHGGGITAHSNAESGATFTVDLPVRQTKAVEIKNAGW